MMNVLEKKHTGKNVMDAHYPDFMIIGAAKSGTTSLHAYLQRHPGIFMPELKEPEFFSRPETFARGMDWYLKLFSVAPSGALCGEASTTYTKWPHAPHSLDSSLLIKNNVPTKKFIYLLRNPIQRCYSNYVHHMRYGVTMTFEEALERVPIHFDGGDYMMQLDRYLRFYDASCFHIAFAEELKNNPKEVLNGIQNFLGIECRDLTEGGVVEKNPGQDDHYLRHKTTGKLRSIPGVSPIVDKIPQQWRDRMFHLLKRSVFGRNIATAHQVPPFREETRKLLIERFRPSIDRLAEFTHRDLSHWLK